MARLEFILSAPLVLLLLVQPTVCFAPHRQTSWNNLQHAGNGKSEGPLFMFFANEESSKNTDEATNKQEDSIAGTTTSDVPTSSSSSSIGTAEDTLDTPPVQLVVADSEGFLNAVGSFLVDSFWLNSDHHQLGSNAAEEISSEARMNLVIEQCADLQEKYGERMGRRLARSIVIGALDEETQELIGAATLKETLLINNDMLEPEKAEVVAQNAVASLGPKQRREYKNAPITAIASELLSPDTQAVCVLSNLAVSRKARRRGVGRLICEEMEALAQEDWGYDAVHLLVEKDNSVARQLYEGKLGYKELCMIEAEPALRVDTETGEFKEVEADSLVLFKQL